MPGSSRPVTALKGVGAALAARLAKLGVETVQDLLFLLPLRYEDRTRIVPIGSLRPGDRAVVEGEIELAEVVFRKRRTLLARLADGTGFLTLRFFYFSGAQQEQLVRGTRLRCFGEVRRGPVGLEIVHPEYRRADAFDAQAVEDSLTPVYPATEGIQQGRLRVLTAQALKDVAASNVHDWLPGDLLSDLHLPSLRDALEYVHRPPPEAPLELLSCGRHPAQRRLAFEELLAHHLSLRLLRREVQRDPAWPVAGPGALEDGLLRSLPFDLTGAQRRVLGELRADLAQANPMMRLVQGDVGSGKTVVAALAALRCIEAGHQAALMAPTELLAEQHAQNFARWLAPLGVELVLLSGRLKGKARQAALDAIAAGTVRLVIGTHALFQEGVRFEQAGAGHRRRAASLRRAPAAGAAREGPLRQPLPAPADHDGDAHPAHAGDDRLRGPRRVRDRRAAARPHARDHGRAARVAARRGHRTRRCGRACRPAGLLGVPADRGIRRARGAGRGGHGRRAGGGAARHRGGPGARPHAGGGQGQDHGPLQGGRHRPAGRHHRGRGRRGRPEREPDGHRECRAHGPRPVAPAARPGGPRQACEQLRADVPAAA